jgi:hypothetical protein
MLLIWVLLSLWPAAELLLARIAVLSCAGSIENAAAMTTAAAAIDAIVTDFCLDT